jgi:hypothetical protein
MAFALGIFLTGGTAHADVIYAASGSGGSAGDLYTLNPSTGAPTLVGALIDALGHPYGLTGLAFDPVTGVLYGSTGQSSPTGSAHLVTVDPVTALVTDIGSYGGGSTMSDLNFVGTTLYGVRAASGPIGSHTLATINLATGAATDIAGSSLSGFGGGGLAGTGGCTMYNTPDSATSPPGHLDTITCAGVRTAVATLSGAPLFSGTSIVIDAMAFDGSTLLGINIANSATHLVSINTLNGVVTDIGPSANNLDAIAVLSPEPSTLLLFGLGAAVLAWRRRR